MSNKRIAYCFLTLLMLLCVGSSFAQEAILRLPPFNISALTLNEQIVADSVANGIVPNRVFVLQRGGAYRVQGIIRNYGWALKIRANDSATTKKPIIFLYPIAATGIPPGQMVDIRGDLYLKNLIISGYYEPIDSNLNNLQGSLFNTGASGKNIYIDSCILSNTNGNHIRTDNAPATVKVTNTLFANMGFLGKSNFGAGKGLDVRAGSVDSLIIQNCSFVNYYDRIVRHYSSTAPIKYFKFDHNTLVNGCSYHGMLSLGKVSGTIQITNNLLYDAFAMGNDTDFTRQVEFSDSGEKDAYGRNRMTWVITVPNDTLNPVYVIRNNFYTVSDSGQAFFNRYAAAGVTGEGAPLTWYINKKLGADSTKAFTKIAGLKLNTIPNPLNKLMGWYRDPNGGNKTKNTPSSKWNVSFDFDRKGYVYLRDTLDCKYPTTSTAYTGADSKQPAGSLTWWGLTIAGVQRTGDVVPTSISLDQNYPNPFNPNTTIGFAIPKAGFVTLTVYNTLGQEVATVVRGEMAAGRYNASFDASSLSSGMYMYRLNAGDYTSVRKMMLLK